MSEKPRHNFGFKPIGDYTDDELKIAILEAKEECEEADLNFYSILRGVDAYMEKRRRKNEAEKS